MFGQLGRYMMPALLIYTGIILFASRGEPIRLRLTAIVTTAVLIFSVVHLIIMLLGSDDAGTNLGKLYEGGKNWSTGGLIPGFLAGLLAKALGNVGALIVVVLMVLICGLYAFGMSINGMINASKKVPQKQKEPKQGTKEERLVNHLVEKHQVRQERKQARRNLDIPIDDEPKPKQTKKTVAADLIEEPKKEEPIETKKKTREPERYEPEEAPIDEIELDDPTMTIKTPIVEDAPAKVEPPVKEPAVAENSFEKMKRGEAEQHAEEISEEIAKNTETVQKEYSYPSIQLLAKPTGAGNDGIDEMRESTKRLADALSSFGVEPHIVNVIRGPSITRYELELDRGVKLSRITNLADDIALALGASGVRISAIPDRMSVVGIEVPNKSVNKVFARDVIGSKNFLESKSKVSFAVGKDIAGNCIVGDIAKLPHMLIAGTTGSGKSVCTNTLIVSLLYKAKPEEVRLIMVDPKMVELGVYNGIPHLLIPVVTDPRKAAGALQWTVTEMMRRYRLMSELGVRDLESYNKAIAHDPDEKKMPQIVVVIDELADLMLVAAKEVEESICRIAQMGRASGIHLVIATQRPSADVITGLMKANIPSRIAFAVSSAMESRIILDTAGAEKLVGKGDMLFAPLGQGKPKRVQGCFIDDNEVQAVVNAVKSQAGSDYSNDIIEQIEKSAEQSGKRNTAESAPSAPDKDGDELLPAAVEVIFETGQASASMLQRRLKLGYARAARIVDELQERGIVGPFEGAKPRQLLITREQWEQMQNGTYDENPPVEEEIP
ncbi:MAG: DNA translocase FtsK [Ruminococcaceae bacterium]|nr:DNA translocase FtsK [Oscillospiraceae bacterium]